VIPKKEKVLERARELYVQHCYRNGCPDLANVNPEDSELAESGFVAVARSELMTSTETKNEQWLKKFESAESCDFEFDLPEAMRSGVLISGTTGTGKSDLAMYLTDQLTKHGITMIVFDSSQDWQSRSSIAQYQTLTFPHIDTVPENSVIFDISRLSVEQRQRFIESFSETLYRHQSMNPSRKQFFLVFEEGSSYFKEGFMRAKRFSNTAMLMSEGRNYGVRFMVITQFFASIDKMTMRYMRQRYFGSTNEPRDVEYITRFFSREQKEEIGKTLRSLGAGSFLYMNGSETKRIHVEPYECENTKTEIVSSQHAQVEPIKQNQNISVVPLLRLAMLLFFIAVIANSLRL